MKSLFLGLILLLGAQAQAGFDRGNGGDALICTSEYYGKKVFLYDHFEAMDTFGLQIDFGGVQGLEPKVKYVLNQLNAFDPAMAAELYKRLDTFWAETKKLRNRKLIDIPDTDLGAIPHDCEMIQTMVQVVPRLPGQKRYTVNMDIWDKLDDVAKAGFILHEILLPEFHHHESTGRARYFNSVLSGPLFKGLGQVDYFKLLETVDIQYYKSLEHHDMLLNVSTIEMQDGLITKAVKKDFLNFNLTLGGLIIGNEGGTGYYGLKADRENIYYGSLSQFTRNLTVRPKIVGTYYSGKLVPKSMVKFNRKTEEMSFQTAVEGPGGKLISHFLNHQNFNVVIHFDTEVVFHKNGMLKEGIVHGEVLFKGVRQQIQYKKITVSRTGEVLSIR